MAHSGFLPSSIGLGCRKEHGRLVVVLSFEVFHIVVAIFVVSLDLDNIENFEQSPDSISGLGKIFGV